MAGYQDNITSLMEKRLFRNIELGDNNSYAVKGVGKTSIEWESSEKVILATYYMYQV